MGLIIVLALAVVVCGFIGIVASRSAAFFITRSATIPAAPDALFGVVNDLREWRRWSPWEGIDPNLKRTYDGPPAGVGATYSWAGNSKAGEGRMTVTESRPSELVGMRLEFVRPFKAVNAVEFTFKTEGDGTVVTWSMSGKNNFAGKAFGMLMNLDKMCGGDFEKGLAQMKSAVLSLV